MSIYTMVLPIGIVVSFLFCLNRSKGFSLQNLIFKAVSSLCFLLTSCFALIENPKAYIYGAFIIFGGSLGLVGDIMLDLKGMYKEHANIYLRGGFIFFLIGHLFYSAGIIHSIKMKWWIILVCLGISALASLINILSARIQKVHFGAYRKIVFIYSTFLFMTMMLSFACCLISHFERQYVVLAIGAASFALSDAILSGTYFGRDKDKGFHYFINHFTYYIGQYLIAASVLLMK